jgi:hypothetical protein
LKAKPVLIAFLSVAAAMVAGSIYLAATVDRADKTVVAVAAPDGKYKAVRLTISGDRPVPFCVETISIFLTVYPDSFAESDKSYEVYGAPCAAPEKRAALPKIEWLSNMAVRIAYPAAAAGAGKQPRLRLLDASKFVQVTFVVGD